MKTKNTALFGASLLAALGAISADHLTSDAPKPKASQEQEVNPCAAAMPVKPGQRNYDDMVDDYNSDIAPAPTPAAAPKPETGNPCSIGSF
jgi:hypothetical protein